MHKIEEGMEAIDQEVANRIYRARKELGMSRLSLAKAIGVSHQQVAKYESADNRVSISKLVYIARKLQKPLGFFIFGLPEEGVNT